MENLPDDDAASIVTVLPAYSSAQESLQQSQRPFQAREQLRRPHSPTPSYHTVDPHGPAPTPTYQRDVQYQQNARPRARQATALAKDKAQASKTLSSEEQLEKSLLSFIGKGNIEKTKHILQNTPGTLITTHLLTKCLRYAAARGSSDILKLLEESGACVSFSGRGINPETPLHTAVRFNRYEAARWLLVRGAAVDALDQGERTPLNISFRLSDAKIAELLLNCGADICLRTKYLQQTPLHIAAAVGLDTHVKLLLDRKASVSDKDITGRTPLHIAVKHGNMPTTRYIIRHGIVNLAELDQGDENGDTPLHLAIHSRWEEVANVLIRVRGAASESRNKRLITPLLAAIQMGLISTVVALLLSGVAVDAEALCSAIAFRRHEIVARLIATDADVVNQRHGYGYTPLHKAVKRADTQIVAQLLRAGADVNAKQTGSYAYTALHEAVRMADTRMVAQLLGAGADVDAKDPYRGETPLHYAVRCYNAYHTKAIVTQLIAAGANVCAENGDGQTAVFVVRRDLDGKDLKLLEILSEAESKASKLIEGKEEIKESPEKHSRTDSLIKSWFKSSKGGTI